MMTSQKVKLQTVKSHAAMAEAMANTAKAMKKMNKAVDAPAITKMMAEFEKENMKSEMMQEIMGDAIDDAMEGEENEEEEEKIVNQVLDEIGIDIQGEVPNAPALGLASEMPAVAEGGKVAVGLGAGAHFHHLLFCCLSNPACSIQPPNFFFKDMPA